MRRFIALIGSLCIALAAVLIPVRHDAAFGEEEASPEACRSKVVHELGQLHDEFRARVFGARLNDPDDDEGTILTGGKVDAALTGSGYIEMRGRMTSELIEPMVESYRVLRCRSVAVCKAMQQSFDPAGDTTLTIRTLGCEDRDIEQYTECGFDDDSRYQDQIAVLEGQCGALMNDSLAAERATLKLAVSYDAGFRSALQLGGMIDWMQGDFPSEVLSPIRDMVNLLGKLHEIPCFTGQCDQPDTFTP